MPRNKDIKKVLVIGSGPIVIRQAAEFDYAGTQACRSLKEEGVEVVLVNSNPATIMTDKEIADEVYIEPLTVDVLEKIIAKEKPDSVLPTLGGQAGLNLGMELAEPKSQSRKKDRSSFLVSLFPSIISSASFCISMFFPPPGKFELIVLFFVSIVNLFWFLVNILLVNKATVHG